MVGRAVAPGLLKTEFGLSEKQESGGGVEVAIIKLMNTSKCVYWPVLFSIMSE